jgi:hypothetical protein
MYIVWEALFVIFGIFLAGLSARNLARGSANRNWPQAEGRILQSFVYVDKGTHNSQGFVPRLEYEYSVGGVTFRSMRLRFGQTGGWSREQAERTVAPFAVGAPVPVFYDPANPKEAVLIQGTSWGNLLIAFAGLAFLFFAWLVHRNAKPD